MNIRLALLAAGALLISSGCVATVTHGTPPGHSKDRYHVHGVGCGHAFVGGRWIPVARPHGPRPRPGTPHVHGPDCGHAHDNGQWVPVVEPQAPANQPHPTPPGGSEQPRPHHTPPGQTGKPHPHGAPPGQTKPHPHGAPPGQTKKEHDHGVDCGHVLVKGKWVHARPEKEKKKKRKRNDDDDDDDDD